MCSAMPGVWATVAMQEVITSLTKVIAPMCAKATNSAGTMYLQPTNQVNTVVYVSIILLNRLTLSFLSV